MTSTGSADQLTLVEEAQAAQRAKNWMLALARWEECLARFGSEAQPWWYAGRANALLRLDRADDAERLYRQLTVDHPDRAAGYAGLADIAGHRQDWTLALSRWDTCIERFGAEAEPWWQAGRANALLRLERLDAAEQLYEKLTADYPDHAAGHIGLADVAGHKRDWTLALGRWQDCIERFGAETEPWWYKQKADALAELGRLSEAKAVFTDMVKEPASSALGLVGLAKVSFLSGEMEECLSYSRQLIQSHPAAQSGYRWAMESLLRLERFQEAADIFLSAPVPDPDFAELPAVPLNYPAAMVLPPLRGDGNDYSFIEQQRESLLQTTSLPTLLVSIIVPLGERKDLSEKTLEGLANQTYPNELIEVVLVGDGVGSVLARLVGRLVPSLWRHFVPLIRKYERTSDLRFVWVSANQSEYSILRNRGIRAASHGSLVILNVETLSAPHLIERFMQYLHVSARAAPFEADIEAIPNDLKHTQLPFLELPGHAMAFPRSAIDLVGGFDEGIDLPDAADLEFAYRLYNAGYYFIPIDDDGGPKPLEASQDTDISARDGGEIVRSQSRLQQKCPVDTARMNQTEVAYEIPKVSIVVPAHNVERFIREAVDSVLSQSFHDLEVVICNDGSTDRTLQIIEDCYKENPRVRYVTQPNKGIAAAINAAVAMSRGMYIGQVDGDDILMPQAVERAVAYLDEHDVGVVYGRQSLIDRFGSAIKEMPSLTFSRERLLVSMICTHFWMFRKRDWMRIDGCDESLSNCVDYDLMLKLSEVCSIGQLPEITYGHRWHGGNTSIVHRPLQEANHVAAINRALLRMGLSDEWEAQSGPVSNPWSTVFRRIVDGNGSTA